MNNARKRLTAAAYYRQDSKGGTGITATAHPSDGVRHIKGESLPADVLKPPAVAKTRRRSHTIRRALAFADLTGLSVSFLLSFYVSRGGTSIGSPRFGAEVALFALTLPLWLVFAKTLGLYARDDARADHSTADEALGIVNLVTLGTWVVFISAWATNLSHPELGRLVGFWALALFTILGGRITVRTLARRTDAYVQTGLVLGAGQVGQLVARKIHQHPEFGIRLVGFVDEEPLARRAEVDHLPVLGGLNDLADLVSRHSVERVIVAFSGSDDARTMNLVRSLRDQNVMVDVVPRLYELVGPRADIHMVEGLPLLTVPPARLPKTSFLVKRILDISCSAALLAIASPIFVISAIRIKLESPGPVFFRQQRLGINRHPFTVLKFRTMKVDTDHREHLEYIKSTMTANATLNTNGTYKLDRSDAVTRFGCFLRRTSLDELPQLINVLRGEMSLVGPRPCLEYETGFFEPHHFDRFLVPQGMTGLWQVSARAKSTFGEALEMDVAYVRGWSLGLDLTLLFKTPFALLRQRRATA